MNEPNTGPFREAPPKQPRFVCTICFRTATTDEAGLCRCAGGDGNARLPLDNPEVIDMVRAHAAERARRSGVRRMTIGVVGAVVLALVACVALGLQIDTDRGMLHGGGSWFAGLAFAFVVAVIGGLKLTERTPPTDTQALLAWLGVKVEP